MVEKGAHRLDRLSRIATELRRAVAEDMEPSRGHSCCPEIPPEARVERAARHSTWSRSGLPERGSRIHRRHFSPNVRQRGAQRLVGWPRQLSAATLSALAAVAVEGGLAFEADVSGGEVKNLASTSSREDEGEQDRSVTSTCDGVRDHGKQPA